jgi:hypothetical protein
MDLYYPINPFVILSGAKDLAEYCTYKTIIAIPTRFFAALRMTGQLLSIRVACAWVRVV